MTFVKYLNNSLLFIIPFSDVSRLVLMLSFERKRKNWNKNKIMKINFEAIYG